MRLDFEAAAPVGSPRDRFERLGHAFVGTLRCRREMPGATIHLVLARQPLGELSVGPAALVGWGEAIDGGAHERVREPKGSFTNQDESGGLGRISNWIRLLQPCRMDVPTQSVPVSPPPMTMTSFPLALI